MLGILAKIGLGGTKSKIFLGIVLTMSVLGGILYLRFDSVKESLILANKEIEDIAKELRTSEGTIRELERDIKLVSELLEDKQDQRRESREVAQKLSQALQNEVENNEDLKMCLGADMSGYVNSLPASAHQNGNRDNSNSPSR